MTPEWINRARCRELGLTVDEFIPPRGKGPSERAIAACGECEVAEECATDRGKDIGLRAGVFVGDRGRIIRPCVLCKCPIEVRSSQHKFCQPCRTARERRRKRPAWKVLAG